MYLHTHTHTPSHHTHKFVHIPMVERSGDEEHIARDDINEPGLRLLVFLEDGLGTGPGAASGAALMGALVPRILDCEGDLLRLRAGEEVTLVTLGVQECVITKPTSPCH